MTELGTPLPERDTLLRPDQEAATCFARTDPDLKLPRLASLLGAGLLAGRVLLDRSFRTASELAHYAVAIPVRDEETLLPRALSALSISMRRIEVSGVAVFVLNNTTDSSFELIVEWAHRTAIPCAVVDLKFLDERLGAPHARRIAMDIGAQFAPDGVLLTTDADSYVGSCWVEQCVAKLTEGYDLVCEDIKLDEAELNQLPDCVRRVGEIERAYFEVCEHLWRRWTELPTSTFAYRASGASMAVRTEAYCALGGLPTPTAGEDSALCESMREAGYEIAILPETGTRTSARLDGRAVGGCGGALLTRASTVDPFCDSALIPISYLRKRALSWGARANPEANFSVSLRSIVEVSNPPAMRLSEVVEELALGRMIIVNEVTGETA